MAMNLASGPTTTMCYRAIRGATSVTEDAPEAVAEAVRELLTELVRTNEIAADQVLSAIFTATPDIRCIYPAAVARELGWVDVPMLCVAEMAVEDALPRCIRILLHLTVPEGRVLSPLYLRETTVLRPDLVAPRRS